MGGGQSGSSSAKVQVPEEVRRLMGSVTPTLQSVIEQAPLTNFILPNPPGVASLTGGQQTAIGAIDQFAQSPLLSDPEAAAAAAAGAGASQLRGRLDDPLLNAPEQTALQQLTSQVNAPIGSSPATLEALRSFDATVGEQTKNDLALAGLGNSGAVGTALGQARSTFLAPLLQQEIANRQAAVQGLAGIGQTIEGRPGQRVASLDQSLSPLFGTGQLLEQRALDRPRAELGAEGLVQQNLQQQLDAQSQDFLRRQALTEEIGNVVTGALIPSSFGQRQSFDTRGGGLLGGLFGGGSK